MIVDAWVTTSNGSSISKFSSHSHGKQFLIYNLLELACATLFFQSLIIICNKFILFFCSITLLKPMSLASYACVATLGLWALNFHLLGRGWLVGIKQIWIINHRNFITYLEWLCTKYYEVNSLLFCHENLESRGLMGFGSSNDQHTSSVIPRNYLEVAHPHHLTTL